MKNISLKLLIRELKSKQLTLLMVAVLIALTSLSTVHFLNDRIQQAIQYQSKSMIAGDLVLVSDLQIDKSIEQKAQKLGLKTASTLRFMSMIFSGEQSQLSEIKAISDQYPLYGELKGSETSFNKNSVWIDDKLAEKLKLRIGSSVELGNINAQVTGFIYKVPEQVIDLSQLLPKIIVHESVIQKTGLISLGSRISYRLMLSGDKEKLRQFKTEISPKLLTGQRFEDVSQLRNEVKSVIQKVEVFLKIISLLSILFALIASILSLQNYLQQNRNQIALFKCMGFTRNQIFGLYMQIFLALSLFLFTFSFVLGLGIQGVITFFVPQLATQESLSPMILNNLKDHVIASFGLIFAVALPFMTHLIQVPVLNIFKFSQHPEAFYKNKLLIGSYIISLSVLAVMLFSLLNYDELALKSTFLIISSFILFGFIYSTLIHLAYKIRNRFPKFSRLSIANLKFYNIRYSIQLSSLTLGLATLLILFMIRNDLIQTWQEQLPPRTPNHFLVNMQFDQAQVINKYFQQQKLGDILFYPVIKGRLVAINDKPINIDSYEDAKTKRLLQREYNLSYASNPLINKLSKTVSGNSWNSDEKLPMMSIEQSLAERMNVNVGDYLTYQVETQTVKAKIVHIRSVNWNSFQPNFFIIYNPSVRYLPQTYMTSVYIAPKDISKLHKINKIYKNISILDMRNIIEQVQNLINTMTYLIQGLFIFVLLSGLMILLASTLQVQTERQKELKLLYKLGLTRLETLKLYAFEFGILGLLLGFMSTILAFGSEYFILAKLLDVNFKFNPMLLFIGLASGLMITIIQINKIKNLSLQFKSL